MNGIGRKGISNARILTPRKRDIMMKVAIDFLRI